MAANVIDAWRSLVARADAARRRLALCIAATDTFPSAYTEAPRKKHPRGGPCAALPSDYRMFVEAIGCPAFNFGPRHRWCVMPPMGDAARHRKHG